MVNQQLFPRNIDYTTLTELWLIAPNPPLNEPFLSFEQWQMFLWAFQIEYSSLFCQLHIAYSHILYRIKFSKRINTRVYMKFSWKIEQNDCAMTQKIHIYTHTCSPVILCSLRWKRGARSTVEPPHSHLPVRIIFLIGMKCPPKRVMSAGLSPIKFK